MTKEDITHRYGELFEQAERLDTSALAEWNSGVMEDWHKWSTNALQLVGISFGHDSIPFQRLKKAVDSEEKMGPEHSAVAARGVFLAAREDFEAGFAATLEKRISGQIFGDLLDLARSALSGDQKDCAAVLAAAAFEDSLKKIGTLNGLNVADKELQAVVNALKGKQILTGIAGRLADQYVRVRNAALHAQWEKINREEVGGLIGFVGELLVRHLS